MLAVIPAIISVLFVVLQLAPVTQTWATALTLCSSFLTYAAVFPVLWLLALAFRIRKSKRRILSISSMVAALVSAGILITPLAVRFGGSASTPAADSLRVVSLNLEIGGADLGQLLKQTVSTQTDVVVLVELTPQAQQRLAASGFTKTFPYVAGEARGRQAGTAIYSRTPITELASGNTLFKSVAARVSKGNTAWTIIGVHPVPPVMGVSSWSRDGAAVAQLVAPYRSSSTVVAGDFNAIPQHYTMQQLYNLGYDDAVRASGSGWHPTWPMGYWIPPMLDIDHALVSRQVVANSVESFDISGTDHRGLRVTVSTKKGDGR